VEEVAALAEAALTPLEKDIAFPRPIEFSGLSGVSSSEFFDAVGKSAPGLIRTISFRQVIFAKFDFEAAGLGQRLPLHRSVAFASV
jgi:hypothetical protein